jgi:hypothetical protein
MRRSIARLAIALGTGSLASIVALEPGSSGFAAFATARAQSDSELAAARKMFSDALADQQAGQYAAALEKFQRVQAVRDTQAVRYRIATCLEALGKLRAALAAYTSTSVATANDAQGATIARASREKADALSKRVARLIVTLAPGVPADAAVKVDGEPVQANALGTPILIDPGAHEVTATAAGSAPFHTQVSAPEGGESRIDVSLEALPRLAPPPVAPAAPLPPPPPPPSQGVAPPPPEPRTSGRTTAGVVAVTASGVLLASSVVLILAREADIHSLDSACPGGVCPAARRDEVTSTRNRALLEGPIAIGVGAGGLVAAAIGIYLLAVPAGARASALAPWLERGAEGVVWRGAF